MYYTRDVSDIGGGGADEMGQLGADHPSGYRPDSGLVDAVNVALILNRPLLITGEPGTGKTQLAYSVAWQLASRKQLNVDSAWVEKFETKSTSLARDLFYSFDTLRRFQAAHTGASLNNVDYITYNALGRALLNALPRDSVASYWSAGFEYRGATRSVVVIDEIDKAPRDFPNDLLGEIDHMYFRIPELNNAQIGGPRTLPETLKPIVVITSNSEKNLPDPFLRRCIYFNIPFPGPDDLRAILLARLRHLDAVRGPLIDDALDFFLEVRERNLAKRHISPAELIQWLTWMLRRGAKPADRLRNVRTEALAGLSALTKDPHDQERLHAHLESRLAG